MLQRDQDIKFCIEEWVCSKMFDYPEKLRNKESNLHAFGCIFRYWSVRCVNCIEKQFRFQPIAVIRLRHFSNEVVYWENETLIMRRPNNSVLCNSCGFTKSILLVARKWASSKYQYVLSPIVSDFKFTNTRRPAVPFNIKFEILPWFSIFL